MYTEEDLRCALYADLIDRENTVQHGGRKTPYQTIYTYEGELFNGSAKSDSEVNDLRILADRQWFIEHTVTPNLKRYERGKEVLQSCKIIASYRSICLGRNALDEMISGETVMSPILTVPAGYIATSEAFRYYTLALKKSIYQQ